MRPPVAHESRKSTKTLEVCTQLRRREVEKCVFQRERADNEVRLPGKLPDGHDDAPYGEDTDGDQLEQVIGEPSSNGCVGRSHDSTHASYTLGFTTTVEYSKCLSILSPSEDARADRMLHFVEIPRGLSRSHEARTIYLHQAGSPDQSSRGFRCWLRPCERPIWAT